MLSEYKSSRAGNDDNHNAIRNYLRPRVTSDDEMFLNLRRDLVQEKVEEQQGRKKKKNQAILFWRVSIFIFVYITFGMIAMGKELVWYYVQ